MKAPAGIALAMFVLAGCASSGNRGALSGGRVG